MIESLTDLRQFATFYIGELLLGVPIQRVQEINRQVHVTRVPHVPRSIKGVVNLRGDVLTVIDLEWVLSEKLAKLSPQSRNIVVQSEGQMVGFLVDRVADIVSISRDAITVPPANIRGVDGRYFSGVYASSGRILVILDIDEVLGSPLPEGATMAAH